MNVRFKNFLLILLLNLATTAIAECPKTEEGNIDYNSIPILVQDGQSDIKSGAPTYYFNTTLNDWDLTDTGSGYSISTTDLFEIQSLGICIDDGVNVSGDALHMKASLKNYPLSYQDSTDSKSYITGSGPLGTDVGIPEDFHGFMVFSFTNSAKLRNGTPVYSMVVEMEYSKGATMLNAISEGFPKSFFILKSANEVSSTKEFSAYKLSPKDTIIGSFKGEPSTISDFKEIDPITGEVATSFNIEQGLKEFKAATGIGKNSTVLIKISTLKDVSPSSSNVRARKKKKKFSTVSKKLSFHDSTPSKKTKLKK